MPGRRMFVCALVSVMFVCPFLVFPQSQANNAVSSAVPQFGHVFIVLEENHSFESVIGTGMPYLTSLGNQYGLATRYFANTHPSIGNYFMLTTGQIITNDSGFGGTVTEDNIVRQLLAAGKTWKSYAESLPSVGYTGDGPYPYARRHNPLSYLSDVVDSPAQRNNLVPFSQFATDLANRALPQYSFIVPNLLNDAHDGTLAQADRWLQDNIAPLIASQTFQQDGLLVIVFDESFDSDTEGGGGHVAMVVISPKAKSGYTSTTFYQHQSTLRMMAQGIGLTNIPGAAAAAAEMCEFFLSTGSAPLICNVAAASLTPTSATIVWTTNVAATSQVEYGTTIAYGSRTVLDSTRVTSHSQALTGLTANTLYHYRVRSIDAAGVEAVSGDFTLTTPATSPPGSFRDDFNGPPLDPGWSFADTRGDSSFSLTANPGHLQVRVPAGTEHDCWGLNYNTCARMLRAVAPGDAVYETKIDGVNLTTYFQAYGIFLVQDSSNFIRFEFWTSGGAVWIAAWTTIGGAGSAPFGSRSVTLGASNYLRVTQTGSTFTLDYSFDGLNWTTAGSFSQVFAVNQAGMHVDNSGPPYPANTANFDYFSIQSASGPPPPTVSLTSPADGAVVSGTITISANASSSIGIAGVQFKVDGNNIGAEVTSAPYSVSLNTTTLADGSHVLTAVARDTQNRTTTSAPVNVTVSNGAPTVSITSPTSGQLVSGTITISATAASGVGIAGVQFKVDGNNIGTEVTSAPYSVSLNTTTLADGSHVLTAVARDTLSRTTTSAPVSVTVDNTAPIISNVVAGSITPTSAVISWTTNEAADSQVDYGTTTSYGQSTTLDTTRVTGHSQALTNLLANTTYHYRVKSRDAAGNLAISGDFTFTTLAPPPPPPGAFRDDFSGPPLTAGWSFTDPRGNSNWSLTANPGHLQISIPAGSEHDCWGLNYNTCARMLRAVVPGDAVYEIKIDGVNVTTYFQAYGIFLVQDSSNFMRFEYWSNGSGAFVAAWMTIGGVGSTAICCRSVALGTSNYLRVTQTGSTFKLEWSSDGTIWNTAGTFSAAFTVNQAGMHVDNSGSSSFPANTANFDYFSVIHN